jgi:hypothetical protein
MQSYCATAAPCQPQWHDQFLVMLPAIQAHARRAFRRLPADDREEAVQAVVALAAVAYVRLVRLGKAERGGPAYNHADSAHNDSLFPSASNKVSSPIGSLIQVMTLWGGAYSPSRGMSGYDCSRIDARTCA